MVLYRFKSPLPVGKEVEASDLEVIAEMQQHAILANPYHSDAENRTLVPGDILVVNDAGNLDRLAAGSETYVLAIVSGKPAWKVPSGGGGGAAVHYIVPTELADAGSMAPGATVNVAVDLSSSGMRLTRLPSCSLLVLVRLSETTLFSMAFLLC